MVRTLTNAFTSGRLAHAFLLTGVRGVGKTTTARIIARALNCTHPNGKDSVSASEPCGSCDNCTAIASGSHIDVLEMDAASRTGVDDIRELIDGVRYSPTLGQFKVYIIDEVHMLSVNAFNALLKTLEEPPPRVKFIFATTEVRKIPVTVVSRCQRFDLRRVETEVLTSHFAHISEAEGTRFDARALALIVRAADGSVRDGLSLLDQAINYASSNVVGVDLVRKMIGLADQAQVFDLLLEVLKGEIGPALRLLKEQYQAGADPLVLVQDLLIITHWLTRLKIDPESADMANPPEVDVTLGKEIVTKIKVPDLTCVWQMLLKGYSEVRAATLPLEAAEMLLVRLAFVADLPSPADLVRKLTEGDSRTTDSSKVTPVVDSLGSDLQAAAVPIDRPEMASTELTPETKANVMPSGFAAAVPIDRPGMASTELTSETKANVMPSGFAAAVQMFADHGELRLYTHLQDHVHLVRFEPGRIEIRLGEGAPGYLASNLGRHLHEWTGRRWAVAISATTGDPTLAEQESIREEQRTLEVSQHPEVRALLDTFPGSAITRVRSRGARNPEELEKKNT